MPFQFSIRIKIIALSLLGAICAAAFLPFYMTNTASLDAAYKENERAYLVLEQVDAVYISFLELLRVERHMVIALRAEETEKFTYLLPLHNKIRNYLLRDSERLGQLLVTDALFSEAKEIEAELQILDQFNRLLMNNLKRIYVEQKMGKNGRAWQQALQRDVPQLQAQFERSIQTVRFLLVELRNGARTKELASGRKFDQRMQTSSTSSLIAGLLIVCILTFLGVWMGRAISKRISAIAADMTALAKGHTDNIPRAQNQHDEIGDLARAFLVFRDNAVNLDERARELTCLYALSEILNHPEFTLAEALSAAVEILPPASPSPGVICGRITFNDQAFTTANFKETPWFQTSDIIVEEKTVGTVDVFYLEDVPESADRASLRIGRNLSNDIANRIGKFIERKQADLKLHESEERLRLIFESAAIPLALNRLEDGQVNYANSAWLALFGRSEQEVGSIKMPDLYVDIAQRQAFLEKIEVEDRVQGMVAHFKRKNGEKFYASFNSFKVVVDGEATVISGLIDITDRMRTEEELLQHRDHLEELVAQRTGEVQEKASQLEAALFREQEHNILQKKFVALASHEFRTPLAIIDGVAQRLVRRKDKLDADEIETRANKVRSTVTRMVALIDTMLYASRLDAGKLDIKRTPCDVRELLLDICNGQAEISVDHQFNVDVDGLPPEMLLDQSMFEQIVMNLLSNAVKYAPKSPNVEVKGWQEHDEVVIAVTDHGIGIPQDDLPHMFGRFFRASNAEGIKGSGVGLSVCMEFVEMHGGTIEVSSVLGEGSVFTVRLPIDGNTR